MNRDSEIATAAERSESVMTIYRLNGQKMATFTVIRKFIHSITPWKKHTKQLDKRYMSSRFPTHVQTTDISKIGFAAPATISTHARHTPGMQQRELKTADSREANPSWKLPNLLKNSVSFSISLCQDKELGRPLQVNWSSTRLWEVKLNHEER